MATVYEEMKNPNSCLNKAKTDEPLFVLRAKDELASLVVRCWATEAKERGIHADKVDEAFALADKMDAWRAANVPAAEPKVEAQPEVRTEMVVEVPAGVKIGFDVCGGGGSGGGTANAARHTEELPE